jgi:AraC-like DNA-binding protein
MLGQAMHYREMFPTGEARRFIDRYWLLETGEDTPRVQRVVPDGHAELILHLGLPFASETNGIWAAQPECFLAGQLTGPLFLRPQRGSRVLGVRFHPHAAARALGFAMHDATGRVLDLRDAAPGLVRRLETARQTEDLRAVEAAFGAVPSPDPLVGEAVRQMVASRGAVDVARMARGLGVSLRQLERRFRQEVGLPPKLFCRIQRFQRVFQVIEGGRPNWVDAAVQCGYYDQAHLIRDFKDFSGETPAVLVEDAGLARQFLRRDGMSRFSNTQPAAAR